MTNTTDASLPNGICHLSFATCHLSLVKVLLTSRDPVLPLAPLLPRHGNGKLLRGNPGNQRAEVFPKLKMTNDK